jgi:hypothetical protein
LLQIVPQILSKDLVARRNDIAGANIDAAAHTALGLGKPVS